jgi:hypothetical protein
VDLDLIDAERHGPMRVIERGEIVVLPDAADLPWKTVAGSIDNPHFFYAHVWPAGAALTAWKLEAVQHAWVRHNGLPEIGQVRRLVYMLQRYYDGIEYDLHNHLGLSAGQLWRDRRWRELLAFIDRLPTNTHMNRLLTSDEEHMESLMRNEGKAGPGAGRPSMSEWGQLEAMVATLIDAVNRNTATQQAIANPKGAKPQVTPYPRPYSAADKLRTKIQKEDHEQMVSILLPKGRPDPRVT